MMNSTPPNGAVRLSEIGEPVLRVPVKKPRPKGLAPWRPRAGRKNAAILSAALAALDRYREEARLPLGPREVGYVLTGDEFGFSKADIDLVEDVLVRARRAGLVAWEEISDSRTGASEPWQVGGADALADSLLGNLTVAQLDRQKGQPNRIEVWAEAGGWLPRLERICNERGVAVYSGSGSVPVTAVRQLALRALHFYSEDDQRTIILSIGDLDPPGLRNIARPFEEDVQQFVCDYLLRADVASSDRITAEAAKVVVPVRRVLLTADQVEQHIGERARVPRTAEEHRDGWPYPYKVQAEALAPGRDRTFHYPHPNPAYDPDADQELEKVLGALKDEEATVRFGGEIPPRVRFEFADKAALLLSLGSFDPDEDELNRQLAATRDAAVAFVHFAEALVLVYGEGRGMSFGEPEYL